MESELMTMTASSTTAPMSRNNAAPAWLQRWPAFFNATEVTHVYPHRYEVRNSAAAKDSALFSMKRSIDILGAGSALIFFAPLFISIAVAIKLTSPGPVLFSQNRYGYHNRLFRIYKFRTMHTHLGDRGGT